MSCMDIRDKLVPFLLHELDPQDTELVRQHVDTCEACRASAREIELTLGLLRDALAASSSAPKLSEAARRRVLDEPPTEQGIRHAFGDWLTGRHPALAAAAAILVVAGFVWMYLRATQPAAREAASAVRAPLGQVADSQALPPLDAVPADTYESGDRRAEREAAETVERTADVPVDAVAVVAAAEPPQEPSFASKPLPEPVSLTVPSVPIVIRDTFGKKISSGSRGTADDHDVPVTIEMDKVEAGAPATAAAREQAKDAKQEAKMNAAGGPVAKPVVASRVAKRESEKGMGWRSASNAEEAVVKAPAPAAAPGFVNTAARSVSTFSIDVDTASYEDSRECLLAGRLPMPRNVAAESFINAFDYRYPEPTEAAFAVHAEGAPSPFRPGLTLLRIGVQGRRPEREADRPAVLAIQVEFDPRTVLRYRQIGYEDDTLPAWKFREDGAVAGQVGPGQSVTALYEVEQAEPARTPAASGPARLATVRVRYRAVPGAPVTEVESPVTTAHVRRTAEQAAASFRLAAGVAEFAELLRRGPGATGSRYPDVAALLRPVAQEFKSDERIQELLRLVETAAGL